MDDLEEKNKTFALSCDTIGNLDEGLARLQINADIQKALDDLADRGEEDGKERSVVITLRCGISNGIPYYYVLSDPKLPPRRGRPTSGELRMKGKEKHDFRFRPSNRNNVDQPSFDDMDDDRR